MPVFIYDQTDALFIGTDISWQQEWSSAMDGTFGVSYLWSRDIQRDQPLINQPPLNLNYRLNYDLPIFKKAVRSQLSLKPSYTFQQFQAPRTIRPEDLIDGSVIITPTSEIFDFKDAPESYFLLDAAWQVRTRRIDVGISVQNIFNTRYRGYLNEMRYFRRRAGNKLSFHH